MKTKARYQTAPLPLGTKVSILVQASDGGFDLLRGEIVRSMGAENNDYVYIILGETNRQNNVVVHANHSDDTLYMHEPMQEGVMP